VLVVSVVAYGATARRLESQVDAELAEAARTILALAPGDGPARDRIEAFAALRERLASGPGPARGPRGADRFLGTFDVGVVQAVAPDGTVRTVGAAALPVDDATLALARDDDAGTVRSTVEVDGTPVRVLAVQAGPLGVLQVGVPVTAQQQALDALRRQLLLVGLLGVGLAALLGAGVADRAVRPVRRLTEAAEDVERTQDLGTRIAVGGDDELGRLAVAFNGMLASLDRARDAQRALVADASHELRTPLTSLRTNIEVLQRGDDLPADERIALLGDVRQQLEEFGRLVDGLVELARGDRPAAAPTPVPLRDVVDDVVDRAAVFAPGTAMHVTADDSVVVVERDRLERAVANMVDNAVKHGGGDVEVTVRDGAVVVRDHGEGFAPGEAARVFDRFYRAPEARGRPGSGLGLSIVAQVAESHGGSCAARTHPGGGAEVVLQLPTAAADAR
jgi:two-component system sensor histidine kinase MprB